jgi:hypothetical protein
MIADLGITEISFLKAGGVGVVCVCLQVLDACVEWSYPLPLPARCPWFTMIDLFFFVDL